MSPQISIIVPCYKQSHFLDECLNSILNQKFTNWECIIVNDGSPDDTDSIAKKWLSKDQRFVYINQDNGGPSKARNAGIKIAKGSWIQFLDGDDLLEENKLLESSKFFDQNIDLIISGYRYFEDNEGSEKLRILGRDSFLPEICIDKSDNIDLINLFFEKNPFVISAPLYKKNIFDEIGNFNEKLLSLEDWEFNLRCSINGYTMHHIGYLPKSKTLIRLHGTSLMRNEKNMDKYLILFKNILETDDMYKDKYQSYITTKNYSASDSPKDLLFSFIPPILLGWYRKFIQRKVIKDLE